ncbi:hypothetical protein L596_016587 [Steinernema carpocapsae]|uniref:Uncharacterized protein n=1 Tax=Steinernema carpocapsae TaxID=34508 RepID=A0A4U5NJ60_STECR|nr:hypothetical protein L596_016587 [Steinernema carpocapsae]
MENNNNVSGTTTPPRKTSTGTKTPKTQIKTVPMKKTLKNQAKVQNPLPNRSTLAVIARRLFHVLIRKKAPYHEELKEMEAFATKFAAMRKRRRISDASMANMLAVLAQYPIEPKTIPQFERHELNPDCMKGVYVLAKNWCIYNKVTI